MAAFLLYFPTDNHFETKRKVKVIFIKNFSAQNINAKYIVTEIMEIRTILLDIYIF